MLDKLRLPVKPQIKLTTNGLWRIDNVFGKTLTLILMDHEKLPLTLMCAPTHDFCAEFLDKMLEAEWMNDNFVFLNGRYGPKSKRPPQLTQKIENIQLILNKWRQKT
jgi:hypothetical protein